MPAVFPRQTLIVGGAAVGGVALILAQQLVGSFGKSALAVALHNAMHFPWGMLLTLAAWVLTGPRSRSARQRTTRTTVIVLTFAAATEAAQIFTPRDASFRDLAWNAAGAVAMLSLIWSFAVEPSRSRRWSAVLLTLALGVICLAPVGYQAAVRLYLASILPELVDLDTTLGRAPIRFDERITFARMPGGRGAVAVRLEDVKWSGLTLREVFPNWGGYSELVVEAYLVSSEPVAINLRLGFNGGLGPIHSCRLQPGPNRLHVSFADDADGSPIPAVRMIVLYAADRESAGSTLYLSGLRLASELPSLVSEVSG